MITNKVQNHQLSGHNFKRSKINCSDQTMRDKYVQPTHHELFKSFTACGILLITHNSWGVGVSQE